MVEQKIQEAATRPGAIESIPRRIQEVPELIVNPNTEQVRAQVTEAMSDLGSRVASIHLTAAEAYLSQGMYAEAVPHVEAATIMEPDSTVRLNHMGYVCYLAGQDAKALGAFEQALTLEPTNADALFNVGMISFGRNDLETAEASFRACAQFDSSNAELWNNLGVVLTSRGETGEARSCFERALSIEPENEDASYNISALTEV